MDRIGKIVLILFALLLLGVFFGGSFIEPTETSTEPTVAPTITPMPAPTETPIATPTPEPTPTPEYKMYYTDKDVIAMAQVLYGEARGCELLNQQQVVWCVLNRVDDDRFPDTIIGVLSQPGQFHGYSSNFPVWDNLYSIAQDVMTRWSMEKQGAVVMRELDPCFLWFTGTGYENVFRSNY